MPFPLILLALGLGALWLMGGDGSAPAVPSGDDASPLGPLPDNSVPQATPWSVDMTPAQRAILPLVLEAAGDQDAATVLGIIQRESNFNARAFAAGDQHNGDGSYGLMQIGLATARDMGFVGDPAGLFDPATNIALGVAYLDWIDAYLKRRGGGGEAMKIAAYNEGVTNALRGLPDLGYVQPVLAFRAEWQARLEAGVA